MISLNKIYRSKTELTFFEFAFFATFKTVTDTKQGIDTEILEISKSFE